MAIVNALAGGGKTTFDTDSLVGYITARRGASSSYTDISVKNRFVTESPISGSAVTNAIEMIALEDCYVTLYRSSSASPSSGDKLGKYAIYKGHKYTASTTLSSGGIGSRNLLFKDNTANTNLYSYSGGQGINCFEGFFTKN